MAKQPQFARSCSPSDSLDLGHGWPTFADTTAAANAGLTGHEGDDSRGNESSEQEPEEGGGSLELAAAGLWVVRAVGSWVVEGVAIVAARVNTELGSENNTGNEGEESGQQVENTEDEWDGERIHESGGETIEDIKETEDADEDGIVDVAWVTSESRSDDITDETGDDDQEDQLNDSEDELRELHLDG